MRKKGIAKCGGELLEIEMKNIQNHSFEREILKIYGK